MENNQSIDVIIEIPYQSNMKYEMDEDTNRIRLDRVLSSSMTYPGNYGYIDNTLANDGDPLDVLLLSKYALLPGCIVKCKLIGALIMTDEKGLDEKIIAIPHIDVDKYYENINDISDLPTSTLEKIKHFFEFYKKIDDNHWTQVDDFVGKLDANKLLTKYSKQYSDKISLN